MTPRAILIGGPTAAGKSDFALELAQEAGAEIISADSVQIYRGFDIGSAKPSREIQDQIPHHLIDILDAGQRYSAGSFVEDSDAILAEIAARERPAIVVGGTGLYLRSLLYGIVEAPSDPVLRAKLEERRLAGELSDLYRELQERDPQVAARVAPEDAIRIVRALEVAMLSGGKLSELQVHTAERTPRFEALVLTVSRDRLSLDSRIATRSQALLDAGLVDEVRGLRERGIPPDVPPMQTVGYAEVNQMLDGEAPESELCRRIQISTRRLAKRQLTWFRAQWESSWVDLDSPAELATAREAALAFCSGGPAVRCGPPNDEQMRARVASKSKVR